MPSKEELLKSVNSMSDQRVRDAIWDRRKERYSAVYYLFEGDEITYVGQSIRLFGRLREHITRGWKFSGFAFIDTKQELLNETEAKEIVNHIPKRNRRGMLPPNDTYMTINQISKQYRASKKRVEKVIRENNISVSIVMGGVSYYNMRQPVTRMSNVSTERQPE